MATALRSLTAKSNTFSVLFSREQSGALIVRHGVIFTLAAWITRSGLLSELMAILVAKLLETCLRECWRRSGFLGHSRGGISLNDCQSMKSWLEAKA